MVAAILRKLRSFSNRPTPTSSYLFLEMRPPDKFYIVVKLTPPPPIDVETTNFLATNRAEVHHLIQLQFTLVTVLHYLK